MDEHESEEERRWREDQRREDRQLAKELIQIKREVGMVKSELVDIRREVGQRGWIEDQEQERRSRAANEEMERRRDQDGRSDISSPFEEDSDEETTEVEEGVAARPPRPATPGPW